MYKKIQVRWKRMMRLRRRHYRRLKLLSRHPFAVPVITFVVLLSLTVAVFVYASKTDTLQVSPDTKIVIITHDGEQQIVPSREPTVGALLKKLKLTLNQGDVVEPAQVTPINQDEFRINIYRAVPVEIVDGSEDSYTFSAATTPRAIAEQAGKSLSAEDEVTTLPSDNFLEDNSIGEQVVINRATPVNLNLYGTPIMIQTHATTIAALMSEEKIHLAPGDQVMPDPDTPLTANAQVFIIRNGTKIESINETIPTPVQTIEDASLSYGTSAVRQVGSAGEQVITYQDQLKNNIVVGRSVIQTVVTQQPVTEVVVEGTSLSGIKGDMALAGIAPSDYDYADYIISHESGWCPTKAQGEHECPAIPDDSDTDGGYGLCQATPGRKMESAGSDWATNPVTQLKWCAGYAESRYGSWYAAYEHWMVDSNW